jgi:hypothetical protein
MNHLANAVLFGAAIYQLTACSPQAEPRAVPSVVSSTPRAVLATGETQRSVVKAFKTFALHALLLPLLDDETPARWADPSFSVDCDDARVAIDGVRPDIGAPVPDAFTVRWHMERCTPMGLELTGEVELRVESSTSGYSARVHPKGLLVRAAAETYAMNEPFSAVLAVTDSHRP